MSQRYYEIIKRRKRIHTIIIVSVVVVFTGLVLFYHMQSKKADNGYGEIEDVEVTQSSIMEETDDPKKTPIDVITFDVGDALAVLVDYGQVEVLYDAGYYDTGKELTKRMKKYVDDSIEYMIISHSHADHCGGVPEILSTFEVENIITSGETEGDSDQFDYAMRAIKESGAKVIEDDNLTFDLGDGFTLNTIETYDPGEVDNVNNLSVIAYLEKGKDCRILITGDAEEDEERMLIGKFSDIGLFIAGHHMSNTSNSIMLLKECAPDVIVVSCAGPKKSEYGFPQKAALRRCLSVTQNVYATYKSGDVTVRFSEKQFGNDISIDCEDDERLSLENSI